VKKSEGKKEERRKDAETTAKNEKNASKSVREKGIEKETAKEKKGGTAEWELIGIGRSSKGDGGEGNRLGGDQTLGGKPSTAL